MRRLRVFAVPFLTLPVLLVAGCSGSGSGLPLGAGGAAPSAATPSASALPTPSPTPTPSPSPTPAPAPTTPCTVTAGLDTKGMTAYLKALRASDRQEASSSSALFMTDTGVYLRLKDAQRPCDAVPVKLSHFRVDMAHSATKAGYAFTYAPISTVTITVGPGDGKAPGSVPPPPSGCAGTLSVVYVGEALAEGDLPEHLQLPSADSTLDWTLADVSVDRVLDAVFKPPPGVKSC